MSANEWIATAVIDTQNQFIRRNQRYAPWKMRHRLSSSRHILVSSTFSVTLSCVIASAHMHNKWRFIQWIFGTYDTCVLQTNQHASQFTVYLFSIQMRNFPTIFHQSQHIKGQMELIPITKVYKWKIFLDAQNMWCEINLIKSYRNGNMEFLMIFALWGRCRNEQHSIHL